MCVDKRRTPKRRFKEFVNNEGWKEYKLSEIAIIKARIGWQGLTKKEFLNEGEYYLITGTDFEDGLINFLNCHYISKERYDQDSNIQAKNGDVLITKDGTIGKVAYIKNMDKPATLNAGVFLVRGKNKNISNLFLYHYLAAPFLLDYAEKQATGGTIKHLNQNVLVKFPVPLPKIEEQKKIGKHLQNINELIYFNKCKLEKLKALKKAYLTQMFPAEGERKPKLRFAGFNDDWEECKLGDVADIIGGGTPSTGIAEYWDGEIDWYSPTEIGQKIYADGSVKKITELGLKNSSAKLLPANRTILFTSRAGIGDMAILRNNATTNQGFQSLVLKDTCDIYFMYSMGHLIKQYAMQNASGSTFLEISGKQLAKMIIQIPSLHEQQQIGKFFSHIDKLITLHQRKLEKLQNIKKAYLNEMFI